MPSKKKKYNARFPAGRIKKIMQTDEEVGKVAQAVPVIISKALEMFIESLLKKSMQITQGRNAKTLTPSHMKQCILSESRFDFLKDLVKNIPDASVQEDNENNALADSNVNFGVISDEPVTPIETRIPSRGRRKEQVTSTATDFSTQSSSQATSTSTATSRTPVIHFSSKTSKPDGQKFNFSVNSLIGFKEEPKLHVTIASKELSSVSQPHPIIKKDPPLDPSVPVYAQSSGGDNNLCIDEDYDN